MTSRLLILGGTTEAAALARVLDGDPGLAVIYSLAGRTSDPGAQPATLRIGGFGGAEGLAAYLRSEEIAAVVDATHPFAASMRWHALAACSAVGIPQLRLERPGWDPRPGDRWIGADTMADAADVVVSTAAKRIFLTVGRGELGSFGPVADGRRWWLVRSIEPPVGEVPAPGEVILDRGPFTVAGEIGLMRRHRIDLLVTKNSGGDATEAKLEAARRLGVTVAVVARPASPPGRATTTVEEAARWVRATLASQPG